MKCIMVMFDSLNRRLLQPYGCDWTHTPNFKRLAEKTVRFDRAYICSMPCMPARREIHTGRPNFLHRSWGPLEPFDDSMPEMLKKAGVYSHLATDHYHYFEDGGATYHGRYSTWEFFRGQEGDAWVPRVGERTLPKGLVLPRTTWYGEQHYINRERLRDENDHPQSQTFAAGLDFLRKNHQQDNWFLQLETFDPHEPFFVDPKYKDIFAKHYDRTNSGPFEWPLREVKQTPDEVEHARFEYASLLAMCDAYLGKVLAAMDDFDLWKDTMLIVCTDHGFLLGEHDCWSKGWCPWYNENANVPLFIWDPRSGKRNESREAFVQTIDLAPTILEFFGIDRTPDMIGRPLVDAIARDSKVRDAGLFGIHGGQVNVTDGHWIYMRAPNPQNQPLFEYTVMPTWMREFFDHDTLAAAELLPQHHFSFTKSARLMKMPFIKSIRGWEHPDRFKHLLYNIDADPHQLTPLSDPAQEERMIELLVKCMRECEAPSEQYQRLDLPDPEFIL